MILIYASALLLNLTVSASEPSDNAIQRKQAIEKYKDFLKYVKEREESLSGKKPGIAELKAQREAKLVAREAARQKYIRERAEMRKKVDPATRDRLLEAELESEKKRREENQRLFAANRKRLLESLKNVPQVDPHDEFQVGDIYEEFEYEIIEEPEEKK